MNHFNHLSLNFSFQDFDLCLSCKNKEGHPHPMERLGLDLDDGSSPTDQKQINPQVINSQAFATISALKNFKFLAKKFLFIFISQCYIFF